jgi:alkylated DNA repair dioxygenase AlkB
MEDIDALLTELFGDSIEIPLECDVLKTGLPLGPPASGTATEKHTAGEASKSSVAREWRMVFADEDTGSWVRACDAFLAPKEQRALYRHCEGLPGWEFDKPLGTGARQRRGVCMQAAPGVGGYRYSGQTVAAAELDEVLGGLLARVNAELGTDFNSWFLNWYRAPGYGGSAGDYLGAHADNERQLAIAKDGRAVVFGLTLTDNAACVRELRFTRKSDGLRVATLPTTAGQAYVMEGELQKYYKHEVPRALRVPGSRISLTARKFVR